VTPPGGTWLLHGELGSGKTTLTRGFVAGLGGDPDDVSSPTYSVLHRYRCKKGWIHHLDLYRLSEDGVWTIGLEDIVQPMDYLIVEWPIPNGPWSTKWLGDLMLYGNSGRRLVHWTCPIFD
jgi:tRNA threonylcarbamoyladenosine biosynthesis protein TsaE